MQRRVFCAVFAMLLLIPFVRAQRGDDRGLFDDLPWRSIGPAVMGGRIDAIAVVERNPSTMYAGTASGGLWKTTNNGTTWEAVFDHETVSSIGDVAVVQSNPDVVWVGTGEPNNRQSSTFGDGVYKSTDGGRTWKHMGLRDTQHIGRVVIDPVDPDTVYVAALGHLWGSNKERGVYKTTDGGMTWTNTKFIDEDTGFVDIAMDPANRQVLYAAAYQRQRTAWGFNGGGPGSGLYKSTDAARTWKKLTQGLPEGVTGRIGLSVSRSRPNVVYATVEHKNGGIFRSDDAGETWQKMSATNPRPMYYSQIRVDPANDRRIYVLGSNFMQSEDGGRTFTDPKTGRAGSNTTMTPTYDVGVHGDHHALWIDPANSNHLILGNDGGVYFSYDRTMTWDKVNNFPAAQYYAIAVDMEKPYRIFGGLQDTHSWMGPSATRHHIGITNADWKEIDFGDGQYAQADPSDPNTAYIEANDGALVRVDLRSGDRKNIKPYARGGEAPYRFFWTAPLQISPYDTKTLWFGGNRLFKSTDRGDTWTASQDLTRGEDRDKLPIMGVLPSADVLSRQDGVAAWGAITTLAESPVTRGVVWIGTDDGQVQVSRDGGGTWTNVSGRFPGLPKNSFVSRVEPSHHDAGTVYVSFDRHRDDDFRPYMFRSTDSGQSWSSIASNLPAAGWVHVVREHPHNPNLLVAGTETGLYISLDRGGRWTPARGQLPTVPVDDVVIHPRDNDLILGTHGRSLYVLDDMTPISAMTSDVLNAAAHLFAIRAATVMQPWKDESYGAQRQFIGPNPPPGALVSYHLKADAADVKLQVLDNAGKVVRELQGTGRAGLNRVAWDLRRPGPEGVAGGRGPFVLPGRYVVKLAAAGMDLSQPVDVAADPLVPVSDAERQARAQYLLRINDLQARIQRVANAATAIATQATALGTQLKTAGSIPESVTTAVEAVRRQAGDLQRRVGGAQAADGEEGGPGGNSLRGRAAGLFNEIDGAAVQQGTMTGPTAVQLDRAAQLEKDVTAAAADLDRLVTTTVANLNAEMTKANVPRIVVPK